MNRIHIEDELSRLYCELRDLEHMDEDTACSRYNVDFKQEAASAIQEEINYYENAMRELLEYEHRNVNHLRTADNPLLCW